MTGDQLREELHPRFCFTANPRTASNESVVWKVFQTIENALGSPDRKIIPSKLEVAPNALKMWDWTGVDGWMDGYPLDCYDY